MSLLLVDNDVLIKLAHWNLLEALPAAFGCSWSDVARLQSIKFRASRGDKKLFLSEEVGANLAAFLEQSQDIPDPDFGVIESLAAAEHLDSGEVELIAACARYPDALLLTGDKRCLIAFTQSQFSNVVERVAGRVYCLEQCLERISQQLGADQTISRIEPHKGVDTAVRAIFGSNGCTEATLDEGLASYIKALRHQTGVLLAP